MCDHLEFLQDLKVPNSGYDSYLVGHFTGENATPFKFCNNGYKVFKTNKVLPMSRSNGVRLRTHYTHLIKSLPLSQESQAIVILCFSESRDKSGRFISAKCN